MSPAHHTLGVATMSGMLGLPPFFAYSFRSAGCLFIYFFPCIISWQNATCQCCAMLGGLKVDYSFIFYFDFLRGKGDLAPLFYGNVSARGK